MIVDELTIDDLDSVSGGRIELPKSDFVKAWEIAQIAEAWSCQRRQSGRPLSFDDRIGL